MPYKKDKRVKNIGNMILVEPLNLNLAELQIKKVSGYLGAGTETRNPRPLVQGVPQADWRLLCHEGHQQADDWEHWPHY